MRYRTPGKRKKIFDSRSFEALHNKTNSKMLADVGDGDVFKVVEKFVYYKTLVTCYNDVSREVKIINCDCE